MNFWTELVSAKFDTLLLVAVLAFLFARQAPEAHEVLGALLLALTSSARRKKSKTPQPKEKL